MTDLANLSDRVGGASEKFSGRRNREGLLQRLCGLLGMRFGGGF